MQKNYIPQPIDTSDIQLPKELNLLLEQIAKNVHEEWSKGRMEEGWTYGKERNDVLKQHPCLIHTKNYLKRKRTTTEILL